MEIFAFEFFSWPHLSRRRTTPTQTTFFEPVRGRQLYERHLNQMQLCEHLGFDGVCLNKHHAKPYGVMPSPNLIAAALSTVDLRHCR